MNDQSKMYLIGNWKMNQLSSDIDSFFDITKKLTNLPNLESWIAPQALHIKQCLDKSGPSIKVGSQDAGPSLKGAFTGENSAEAIKEIGCHFSLLGHSERRHVFLETHSLLKQKLETVLSQQMTTVYCIGETEQQNREEKTLKVLESQLQEVLPSKDSLNQNKELLILAYEPVWAIGTGKVATADFVFKVHSFVQEYMKENFGFIPPILYGGSVKPANIASFLNSPLIQGFLVGGASLKGDNYCELHQKIAESM